MTRAARFSIRTILLGTLAACFGNAFYRWWRRGSVDWIAVLEFGIGWAIATIIMQLMSRRRKQKQDLAPQEIQPGRT